MTVAPLARQYSSASTLSLVVPDSDGMTTTDPSPRWTDPVTTISAACSTEHGEASSSLEQPCGGVHQDAGAAGRRGRTGSSRPSARSSADGRVDVAGEGHRAGLDAQEALFVEVEHEGSSSRAERVVEWVSPAHNRSGDTGSSAAVRRVDRQGSVVDLEHVAARLQVVAAHGLVVLGQPVGKGPHDDRRRGPAQRRGDPGQRQVSHVDVLGLLAVGVEERLAALGHRTGRRPRRATAGPRCRRRPSRTRPGRTPPC